MTPLQLEHGGHGLTELGWVLGAHMVGMFALAPLSGRIADRFGARTAIYSGLGVLVLSVTTVVLAPTSHDVGLPLGLFLLGYGWNLGFVAGSSLLTSGLSLAERTRVQGVADGVVWSSAALSSLSSGVIVAGASYTALGLLGLGLLIPPAALLLARRGAVAVGRPA